MRIDRTIANRAIRNACALLLGVAAIVGHAEATSEAEVSRAEFDAWMQEI